MRVVHVAPTAFGRGGLLGGGERYPLELARALAAHVDCELVTFGPRAQAWREPCGLRLRMLRAASHLHGHPAHPLAPALPRAVAAADVVHVHHLRAAPSRVAAVTARLRRGHAVVTDHGLAGGDWCGLLPRLFDAFLLVSAYSARQLGAPEEITRVILGGADPGRFTDDRADSRNGVLFVGRLTPHKGVDRLITALPAGARLILAGTAGHDRRPPERDYPELLHRLAAGRDVVFADGVADAELAGLYRSAEVAVLPSVERTCFGRHVAVSELLGLSVIEAMACATPVVCSAIGGIPEIVEDGVTGYLVPPGDVDALHDRLQTLLADRALARRMGRRARERVVAGLTWEHCAARCLDGYAGIPRRSRNAARRGRAP